MIRHLNKGGWLLLLLLFAAAGLTSWLRTRPDIAAPAAVEPAAIRQIDFFMENFRIRQYDAQGRLHYTLMGGQLDHYEADDRAEIRTPDLEMTKDDKRWTVQAERAVTSAGQVAEEIRFLGRVRVQQADGLLIRSETLLFRPATEYMETLEPVLISGNGGDIEAASLQTDLQTGVHTLTRVKGRYVP